MVEYARVWSHTGMTDTHIAAAGLDRARQDGYRELFDNSPIGILNVALDGRPLMVNERAATTFGFASPEDFVANVPSMLALWVDPVKRERAAEILLQTGVLRDFEVAMKRRDGTRVTLAVSANPLRDADGNVIGLQISGVDITDRVRAEQRLEEARSHASIAFWTWRLDTNEFIHSQQVYDVLGVDPAVGEHVHIRELGPLVHPDDREMVRMKLSTIGAVPGKRFEAEFRVSTPDGRMKWLVARGCVDDDGIQVSGSIQDITKQKRVQERLAELNEMKTEFLEVVAHDLRTPLSVAAGYTEFLQAQWDDMDDVQRRKLVENVQRSLGRLNALVVGVSEVTRSESGTSSSDIRAFDLGEVVRSTVEDVTSVDASIDCRVEVGQPLPPAMGDQESIERVVTNLLSNAIKYAPGSPISVEVVRDLDELRVSVCDRGPGIDFADQSKLFRKFSRLSPAREAGTPGNGLGLYICKTLVEASGGSISLESAPGMGSTFSFTVPMAVSHTAGIGTRP
jgi:PAS domain S-box-containing protein